MTFRVERCWGGSGPRSHYFRIIHDVRSPSIPAFTVGHNRDGESWDRRAAAAAKDYVSHFYGVRRRNIRFRVT